MTKAIEEPKTTDTNAQEARKARQAWLDKNVPLIIGLGMFGMLGVLMLVFRLLAN
jgi:hypothetical protein